MGHQKKKQESVKIRHNSVLHQNTHQCFLMSEMLMHVRMWCLFFITKQLNISLKVSMPLSFDSLFLITKYGKYWLLTEYCLIFFKGSREYLNNLDFTVRILFGLHSRCYFHLWHDLFLSGSLHILFLFLVYLLTQWLVFREMSFLWLTTRTHFL